MFVEAIEEVAHFTRPVHTISRQFGSEKIHPGAATFFFVNEFGVAVTAKHVMELIGSRERINGQYQRFKEESAAITKKPSTEHVLLQQKYNYTEKSIVQLAELFLDVTYNAQLSYRWIPHPTLDLAILIFENFSNPAYTSYAKFVKDTSILKQGLYLCRLGYPFPEFTNFQYDNEKDAISWSNTGRINSPRFPTEGMLTRHILENGKMVGLEISTPGLRGQSGGPLFTSGGLIAGMQSSTQHLHLGFDMQNYQHQVGGETITINNQPFLHVGRCVHADVIKQFLKDQGIKYYEE